MLFAKYKNPRVGFLIYSLSFGGITRQILSLLEASNGIDWSGLAYMYAKTGEDWQYDSFIAHEISKHCKIYSPHKYENPFLEVVKNSDILYMTGIVQRYPIFEDIDFSGKKVITVAHGQCKYSKQQADTSKLYGHENILMAVSEGAARSFDDKDKVHIIPNGIDFSRCAPIIPREQVRQQWGVDESTVVLGHIGRIAKDKNPIALAKTIQHKDYHAVYVGTGPHKNEFLPEIKQCCGDRLTLINHTNDIGSILSAIDCLVVASPLEGCSLTIQEAMVAGCPVVATNTGSIPELERKHGQLVYHLPFEPTPDDIDQAVKCAINDQVLVSKARNVAWNNFSQYVMFDNFKKMIDGKSKPVVIKQKRRVGFCLDYCAMGGVTRNLITLMERESSEIEWTGIVIQSDGAFDIDTAKKIKNHCQIFCPKDSPKFKGLVTVSPNCYVSLAERSDFVKIWGVLEKDEYLAAADWDSTVVLTVAHGPGEWTKRSIDISLCYGKRHLFMSVSEHEKKFFPERFREHVHVIFNGVDENRCLPQVSRTQMREQLNIPQDAIVLVFMGRFLLADKNCTLLSEAVGLLGDNYYTVFVGTGPDEKKIIQSAELHCKNNYRILPRIECVGDILNASDVLVVASKVEGGPLTTCEAFFARCPVISTNVGFLPIFEAKYGDLAYHLPDNPTPQDLADQVLRLDEYDLTERAYRVAKVEFNQERYARDFEDIILNGEVIDVS